MATRFWLPVGEHPHDDVLRVVACVASDTYLHVLLEGKGSPPPVDKYDHTPPEMWDVKVATASGVMLTFLGGGGGGSGDHTRAGLFHFSIPADDAGPLILTLSKEDRVDGDVAVWNIHAVPVAG